MPSLSPHSFKAILWDLPVSPSPLGFSLPPLRLSCVSIPFEVLTAPFEVLYWCLSNPFLGTTELRRVPQARESWRRKKISGHAETKSETGSETGTESDTEPETKLETGAETETESETEPETKWETGSETETESDTEPETKSETESAATESERVQLLFGIEAASSFRFWFLDSSEDNRIQICFWREVFARMLPMSRKAEWKERNIEREEDLRSKEKQKGTERMEKGGKRKKTK